MKYKWLNKEANEKVIIFFNGWGMDESVVKHLDCEDFDVLMFYDYNTLDTDFEFEELTRYKNRYLVSWSMGVCRGAECNKLGLLTSSTAINGTLKPIDNEYGIPERIYDLTLRNFSPAGAQKFIKNMFSSPVNLPKNLRDFENQKSELAALKNYSSDSDFRYDRVIISSEDKIIPTKNQVKFWNIEPNIKGGHCPFFEYKSWSELL